MTFRLRHGLIIGAAISLPLLFGSPASADIAGATPLDASTIAALDAAGLDTSTLDQAVLDKVNERLDKAIEAGLLTEEDVARVQELRETGELAELVSARVEEAANRRQRTRQAVVERLGDAGIVVEEGQPVGHALRESGFDRSEIAELMKSIRPERGNRSDNADEATIDERINSLIGDVIEREVGHRPEWAVGPRIDRPGDDNLDDNEGIDEDHEESNGNRGNNGRRPHRDHTESTTPSTTDPDEDPGDGMPSTDSTNPDHDGEQERDGTQPDDDRIGDDERHEEPLVPPTTEPQPTTSTTVPDSDRDAD
ncbi:MAG: hypothetical protein ACI8Y4_000944 [Candidatus Poriferisodalaceae bacterium]|jgi:hypothetical protein